MACPACGGGDWWKAASLPFEGEGWACAACTPPGAGLLRHALAVPVGGHAMTPRTLATVRPGPVLHLWQDGREVARLPLDTHAALTLAADLLCAARDAGRGGILGASCGVSVSEMF